MKMVIELITKTYNEDFVTEKETLGYKNWKYNYLDELDNKDDTRKEQTFAMTVGLNIPIPGVKGLSLDGQFMFERKNTKNRTFANENTFEARDLYNTATTYDANTGALTNNLPWGGILNVTNGNSQNYSIRGQINYDGVIDEIQIAEPSKLLTEVMSRQQALLQAESRIQTIRPISGFRVSNLFTGGSSLLPLGEEIRREIASANEINFIVSFLKVSGVRILLDDLLKFCQKEGNRLRIITTTYCGATQAKAIEQLAALPNTEIRISYNTDIERLHAKSYIFVRNSGMNTAYIGSSNLSKSAQTEGLEWNIRVTSVENPHIIKTALATFEMYWNSSNFEDFRLGGIEKFNKEIHRNIFRDTSNEVIYRHFTLLPHQKQILDKLRVEREELKNFKNLVVAATGTGKTVISAFDYQEFRRIHSRSRILFKCRRT